MNFDNAQIRILIVDDEVEYREVIQMILGDQGYSTDVSASAEDALVKLKEESYHIVLTDLKMGAMDGIDLLKEIKANYSDIEVILITGNGTIENAVDAMKIGAYNYIVKTQKSEKLLLEIERAKAEVLRKVAVENRKLKSFQYLTESRNEQFLQVLQMAQKAAQSDANILIVGESGVGKEMIAKYIHECSSRIDSPFIPVNCSALSENLLESELFGHQKGAFTGAIDSREGVFETSHNGTLFLDEIGDISLSTQVKLLRSLETKTVQRIGSNKLMDIDFRLVCATNKDLEQEIKAGNFREDFYYRINTITLEVPPLRSRAEDLEMFIEYFIDKYSSSLNKEIRCIDEDVKAFLLSHTYSGNIREMKNIIERLVVLSENGRISKQHLPKIRESKAQDHDRVENDGNSVEQSMKQLHVDDLKPLKEVRKELEAEYIKQALLLCKFNVSEAARKLDLSRRQMYNKMNEYDL